MLRCIQLNVSTWHRCKEGFELATKTDSITCESDGTWSKHSVRCRLSPCRLPANLTNVVVTGKQLTPVGGAIIISCRPGYFLERPGLSECTVSDMLRSSFCVDTHYHLHHLLINVHFRIVSQCYFPFISSRSLANGRHLSHPSLVCLLFVRSLLPFLMVWLRARATIMEILSAILVYRDLKYKYVFIYQSISKLLGLCRRLSHCLRP